MYSPILSTWGTAGAICLCRSELHLNEFTGFYICKYAFTGIYKWCIPHITAGFYRRVVNRVRMWLSERKKKKPYERDRGKRFNKNKSCNIQIFFFHYIYYITTLATAWKIFPRHSGSFLKFMWALAGLSWFRLWTRHLIVHSVVTAKTWAPIGHLHFRYTFSITAPPRVTLHRFPNRTRIGSFFNSFIPQQRSGRPRSVYSFQLSRIVLWN